MAKILFITRVSWSSADYTAIYNSITASFDDFYWLLYAEKGCAAIPAELKHLAEKDSRIILNNALVRVHVRDKCFSTAIDHALHTSYAEECRWFFVLDDDTILHPNLRAVSEKYLNADLVINRLVDTRQGLHYIDNPRNLTSNNCICRVDWANQLCSVPFFLEHIHAITCLHTSDGECVRSYLLNNAKVAYSDAVAGYWNYQRKLCIVTLDNRPDLEWVKLSNKSKEDYCARHKFDFRFRSELYYKDKHPVWSKLPMVWEALDRGYKYVLWIDADAIIANPSIDITEIFDDHSIYYSKDCYGLNFGVFAVSNSEPVRQFLRDIEASYSNYSNAPFREQSATQDILNKRYLPWAKEIPVRTWNSYDDVYNHPINNKYENGDFILHLPDEESLNKIDSNYRTDRFREVSVLH